MIAAVIGGTCGAAAAYWSQPAGTRGELPAADATAPIPAVTIPQVRVPASPASRPPDAHAPVQPQPMQQARTEPAPGGVEDPRDAVHRAAVLARLPDVKGLVALREELRRRAEEAGEKELPAAQRQLDEIDRCLTEARALRLKLDAAQFRKGTAAIP